MITPDLFADFNGMPHGVDKTEFYQHDQNWSNRMIPGDASRSWPVWLSARACGKVQCIYLDSPYGIKFNSNFQWSTTSRDVKDGKADHITREPEQVASATLGRRHPQLPNSTSATASPSPAISSPFRLHLRADRR
jgi:adenine-specific DNA-methyltransferase